ncbi:hypothetical protein RIVM261_085790 [Rivularia sp. IAM M-261]|nr:hypothetical protein CAL7716_001780 [Calothrix sp. PCC 7716]GJD23623.1 hypothetical protein RIVM261_085790 [Rivularia sp. IAM M-261]
MKKRLQVPQKLSPKASNSELEQSRLQLRSSTGKAKSNLGKVRTQVTENQEFKQHQIEATKLKIQAKHGTITSQGQERLTVLQAKMDSVLQNKVGQSSKNVLQRVKSNDKGKAPVNEKDKDKDKGKGKAASKASAEKEAFLKKYPVAKKLVAGINEKSEAKEILTNLFKNFKNIGFKYTMVNKSHEKLLEGALEGDCQTLARAFKAVAEGYFGIQGVKVGDDQSSIKKPFISEAGKTPYQGKDPNCDNGKRWFFQNHYWAVWNGQIFDVLFLSDKKPEADMARQKDPLKSMLMPEQEYYETEKGKIVYPYANKYSTAELTMFEKLKNLVNNLGRWLYRDISGVTNKIRSIFARGGNNNSDFEALIREVEINRANQAASK